MSNLVPFETYSSDAAASDAKELKGSGNYMKLKPGRNIVRVLPARPGEKVFRAYFSHFVERPDGTKASFVCPRRMENRHCPACAQADKLQKSKNSADRDLAKRFFPRKRAVAAVIDRADPEAGPKILDMPKTVHEHLNSLRRNEDQDYTHPEDGFDVCIERTGSGQFDTEYKVFGSRNNTPLDESVDNMNEWITGQPDTLALVTPLDEAGVMQMLTGEETVAEEPKQLDAGDEEFTDEFDDSGF